MRSLLYSIAFVLLMAGSQLHAAAICSVSASGVAFGAYNPIQVANNDTAGTIVVTCMGTVGDAVNYSISISPGNGSYQIRKMSGGNHTLRYNLYVDPTRVIVWGDGTSGTGKVSDQLTLSSATATKTYAVYSRITGHQSDALARAYMDNLVVTLSY